MTSATLPSTPDLATLRKAGLSSPEQRAPLFLTRAPRILSRAEAGTDGEVLEVAGSTERVARDRGIVRADGWHLEDYEACGAPLLWCHDQSLPVIGASVRTWVDTATRELMFRLRFVPRETFPFAGLIRDLYVEEPRVMRCTSVGFLIRRMADPTDAEVAAGARWVSLEQDLLELSAVPVPSDPGAVTKTFRGLVRRGVVKGDQARMLAEVAAAAYGLRPEELLIPRAGVVAFWREAEATVTQTRNLVEAGDTYRAELRPAADFQDGTITDRAISDEPKVAGQVGRLAAEAEGGKLAVHACTFAKADWPSADDAQKWLTDNTDALTKWREEPKVEEPPKEGEPKPEGEEKPKETPPPPPPPKAKDGEAPPEGEEEEDLEEEVEKASPQALLRMVHDLHDAARGLAGLAAVVARDLARLHSEPPPVLGGAAASDVALALGEPGGKSQHAAHEGALRTLSRVVDRLSAFNREAVAEPAAKAARAAVQDALAPFLPVLEALRKAVTTRSAATPPARPAPLDVARARAPLYRGGPVLPRPTTPTATLPPDLIRAVLPTS